MKKKVELLKATFKNSIIETKINEIGILTYFKNDKYIKFEAIGSYDWIVQTTYFKLISFEDSNQTLTFEKKEEFKNHSLKENLVFQIVS